MCASTSMTILQIYYKIVSQKKKLLIYVCSYSSLDMYIVPFEGQIEKLSRFNYIFIFLGII